MASLWEIFEASHLAYDVDRDNASNNEDSGSGPPTVIGWIRTGYLSGSGELNPPGIVNCSVWTSSDSDKRGSIVSLSNQWGETNAPYLTNTAPWVADKHPCDSPRPVWCIED